MTTRLPRRILTAIGPLLFLVACASSKREAAPAQAPPAPQQGYASPAPGLSAPESAATQSISPKADRSDALPAQPSAAPPPTPTAGPFAPPPSRAAALSRAATEIDASQRELDVAGGDCRNACRALGSMDRAAGRLCALSQSNDEVRRCGDAKVRVYSARDKVRNTCGTCDDVSVERNAPIPSRP